jgi:hypothetical protein
VSTTSAIETRRRRAGEPPQGAQSAGSFGMFARARSSRYFGGLWFKVFSERGPC